MSCSSPSGSRLFPCLSTFQVGDVDELSITHLLYMLNYDPMTTLIVGSFKVEQTIVYTPLVLRHSLATPSVTSDHSFVA